MAEQPERSRSRSPRRFPVRVASLEEIIRIQGTLAAGHFDTRAGLPSLREIRGIAANLSSQYEEAFVVRLSDIVREVRQDQGSGSCSRCWEAFVQGYAAGSTAPSSRPGSSSARGTSAGGTGS